MHAQMCPRPLHKKDCIQSPGRTRAGSGGMAEQADTAANGEAASRTGVPVQQGHNWQLRPPSSPSRPIPSTNGLSCPGQGPHNKALKTALTRVPDPVREPWPQCATVQSHTTQPEVSRHVREGRRLDSLQCPLGREAGTPVYLLGWFLWCQTPADTVICNTHGGKVWG